MGLTDGILHKGGTDAVTVGIDDLRITVTLWVVDHLYGDFVVDLLLLEVVTDGGLDVQITVIRETESGAQLHLVTKTTAAAVADI